MTRIARRRFLESSATLLASSGLPEAGPLCAAGDDAPARPIDSHAYLFRAPNQPGKWPAFRESLARWRKQTVTTSAYDGALYRRADFRWASAAYSCCFVMLCDETFYDRKRGRFTPEEFLDTGANFGGYDAVVLWQAYPRIGVDDRNQFDFYRDMPGGLPGLQQLVARLHERGAKAFIDYNPWDTTTRRESVTDVEALAGILRATDADGIFLDTMKKAGTELRHALDAIRPGLVLESELALPLAAIPDHHLSWAQWVNDSMAPGVLRNRWFERRHMQHMIRRWDNDHTSELHMAWMNGAGMLVWENVFGSLKPWSARDRSILRVMLPVQRRFHRLFIGEGWQPLVPIEPRDVYASLWHDGRHRLWTIVNRAEQPVNAALIDDHADSRLQRYFDLIRGREITLSKSVNGPRLRIPIGPRGIGAVLAMDAARGNAEFKEFLSSQEKTYATVDWDPKPRMLEPTLRPVVPTPLYPTANVPDRMAVIDIDTEVRMRSTITSRECGFYVRPYTYDAIGKHKQAIAQRRTVRLRPYAIDITPVTNAQFAKFLKSSGYLPRFAVNFLKHWQAGVPPAGRENHPVVYVDLEDARQYARWSGKRLPTEEEWQYAAAGPDALAYPWGNAMESERCNGGERRGTTPVDAYPGGRSPFGCYDMCGNTWEWTESERSDGRTRFCILKGGSWYHASKSIWYTDGGPQPTHHAMKFLMMWPGLDRCATVGFRCAADVVVK